MLCCMENVDIAKRAAEIRKKAAEAQAKVDKLLAQAQRLEDALHKVEATAVRLHNKVRRRREDINQTALGVVPGEGGRGTSSG